MHSFITAVILALSLMSKTALGADLEFQRAAYLLILFNNSHALL
jgi:hypothetical protein